MSKGREKIQKLLGTVGAFWPVRQTKQVQGKLVRWVHSLSLRRRILYGSAAGIILLAAIIPTVQYFMESYRYTLDDATLHLVGKANPNLASKLTYDHAGSQWQFNKDAIATPAGESTDPTANIPAALKAQIGGGGKSDQSLYAINFPTNPKKGVTIYDSGTQLSFTMVPQFKVHSPKATKDSRLVYPMENGAQLVYTPKNNGMKEDIILPEFIGNEVSYSYKLDLPDSLTARVQADGSVGVFSVDPGLLGNVSTSSNADAEKLKSAREHAEKNHLLFAIPAPVIVQTGNTPVKATAKFGLANNILTVTARDMDTVQYPASVDPSVVVTSSSDFQMGGNNENNIDYGTDEIKRGNLTGGTVGNWATTTAMDKGYESVGMVAYNGYLYRIGGTIRSPQSVYQTTYYAPINSNGTIGSWTATTGLPASYGTPQITTYNGYMYLIADVAYSGTSQVVATTYYSKIASDGTLGSWTSTTSLPQAITGHAVVAAGGHIYTLGGSPTSAGACGSNNDCMNTVYYAPLNGDGTIGSWSTTSSFTTARARTVATVYGDYIYIGGGGNTGYLNDVQYARINSDGTLGSWTSTSSFTNARYGHQFAAYNGYMYMYSGRGSSWYSDVQYAQIRADGTLGSWATTTAFSTGRAYGGGAIYNGYLYLMGGYNGSVNFDDVQYTKIDDAGTTTPYTTSGNTFTTTRRGGQTVVYNGYLYVMGGDNGGTPVNTVYYAAINADGTIGTFASTNAFTTNRTYFSAVAYGGYMYVIGGCSSAYSSCTTAGNNLATVYRAPINTDGSIGTWTNTNNNGLPAARYGTTAVAYNNYLYVIGGLNASTFSNLIYRHAISTTDGSLSGAWSTSSGSGNNGNAPASMAYTKAVAYGGKLYIAGGCTAGELTCSTSRNAVHYATFSTGGSYSAFTSTSAFTTARGDFGLAAVNNRLYLTGGRTNTTYYGDTQSAAINSDGSVDTWSTVNGATLATNRYGIGMASTNGYLYVIGGHNGSTYYNNVQVARVNNGGGGNGNTWQTDSTGTIGTARSESQTVTYNGYLYVLGGRSTGGAYLNSVEYAKINSDGTVGTWATTSSFTTARVTFTAAVMNGYLYILGGRSSSSYLKDIQYALINSDGTLGSWASAGSNVANGGQGACIAAYNGYIYSLNGWDGSTDFNTVRYTATNANGTIVGWQNGPNFTTGRSNGQCIAYGGYLYMIGGEGSIGYNDVQYAAINPTNGSVGSWAYTTAYNLHRANHTAFAYNGYMYIMGGVDFTGTNVVRNDMQYAPINANGTLGEWRHSAALSNYGYTDAAVWGGYAYVPAQEGENTTKYVSLNTILKVGRYSKLVDLGTSGKVTGITYNGSLPGGPAQIDYRTAGNDGVFGSMYNVKRPPSPTGPCIGTYGSGRYVWVSIALDETDGNSANLTDITVIYESYHPSPDARLRGGKTLQNGTLSALDTCGTLT